MRCLGPPGVACGYHEMAFLFVLLNKSVEGARCDEERGEQTSSVEQSGGASPGIPPTPVPILLWLWLTVQSMFHQRQGSPRQTSVYWCNMVQATVAAGHPELVSLARGTSERDASRV